MSDIRSSSQALLALMDYNITGIESLSATIQSEVYKIVQEELQRFEIIDGFLSPEQDLRIRLIRIHDRIQEQFDVSIWDDSIKKYLEVFDTILIENIRMHKKYNDIDVNSKLLTPQKVYIRDQSKQALISGIATEYIDPVVFLVNQQAVQGASIKDALDILDEWNKGEASNGKYTNGMKAPNLTRYATQIARDASYSFDRNVNTIIADRYGLDAFTYAGGIIEDSRPLCKNLVLLNRPILFDELPPLLRQYPQGLYPDTTKDNFIQKCGGYSCRHRAFPVKN